MRCPHAKRSTVLIFDRDGNAFCVSCYSGPRGDRNVYTGRKIWAGAEAYGQKKVTQMNQDWIDKVEGAGVSHAENSAPFEVYEMKKILGLLLLLASFAPKIGAQGIGYTITPPVPNGTLYVCTYTGTTMPTFPCGVNATIYTTSALTTPVTLPVALGASGTTTFYGAAGQQVVVQIGVSGTLSQQFILFFPATPSSGTATFATLLPGTNSNVGTFQFSQANVFTLAQQNDPYLFTSTGGSSCSPGNILNFGGTQTYKLTDALATCTTLPTSGVTNAFTNGMGVYMQNPNSAGTGQFTWVGAVGYYDQIWCTGGSVANTHCWGANFSISDGVGEPSSLIGNEYDIQVQNTTTVGDGMLLSMRGAGQPTSNHFPAIQIQAPQSTATFTSGFMCADGSLSNTNNYNCLQVGQQASGLSQNSQAIQIFASDAGTQFSGQISVNKAHFMYVGGMPVFNYGAGNTTYGGGWGITLKATAALAQNVLVKIDTSNADSVVICTTADTSCDGFVSGVAAAVQEVLSVT